MADPFLGEIRSFAFGIVPTGWYLCDGTLLQISQYSALFSILGTTYGGNGTTTFALPDLRGRTPVHVGNDIALGQSTGEENHVLTMSEMPLHSHQARGSSQTADSKTAQGNVWASSDQHPYSASGNAANNLDLASTGASQGHQNMQPYTVISYCIAIFGIYPPRS
ncbi:MAG: phage tail protein [Chitinophagales bacterium]